MQIKLIDFWKQNEPKIVVFCGLVLVSAISFQFGLIQGKKGQVSPLIIEKPPLAQISGPEAPSEMPAEAQKSIQEPKIFSSGTNAPVGNCAFLGSKNSNKYHLPNCRWGKQIKPENIVCFASVEAAAQKGYLPDKNCIK